MAETQMKPRIKIALGSYDRHAPLLESAVGDSRFDFEFLEVDPRQGRHERFLQDFEFDACELSFSSYVVAMDQNVPGMRFQSFRVVFLASRRCTKISSAASIVQRTSPVKELA